MLTIRPEQMQAFELEAVNALKRRILTDFREHWSAQIAEIGEKEARRWIDVGAERAGEHGIHTQRGIYRYVNLAFLLGPDFDRDPELPWASAILGNPALTAQEKLDRLEADAFGDDDEEDTP